MSDHSKLKALALEVPEGIVAPAAYDDDRSYSQSEVKLLNFLEAATPAVVLGPIAESARLQSAAKTLERLGYRDNGGELWKPPLGQKPDFCLMDQLKAENEALRQDAERYRFMRDQAAPSDWEYISHQIPSVVDQEIDALIEKSSDEASDD